MAREWTTASSVAQHGEEARLRDALPTGRAALRRRDRPADGGRGRSSGRRRRSRGKQRGRMNELLDWGITNSDPEELRRRAEAGEQRKLTPLDKEMLEVLLGQPTAAAMRSCLVKLEPEARKAAGGDEAALLALEELEFHCEDLDNANDLAKMGGVRALLDVGADAVAGDEVREMALGVVAAGLQNNPPFQKACVSLGVPEAMLRLLVTSEGRWSSRRRPVPLARRCSRTRYGHGVRSVFTCSSFQFVLYVFSKPTIVHGTPRPRLPFRSPMPGGLGPLAI